MSGTSALTPMIDTALISPLLKTHKILNRLFCNDISTHILRQYPVLTSVLMHRHDSISPKEMAFVKTKYVDGTWHVTYGEDESDKQSDYESAHDVMLFGTKNEFQMIKSILSIDLEKRYKGIKALFEVIEKENGIVVESAALVINSLYHISSGECFLLRNIQFCSSTVCIMVDLSDRQFSFRVLAGYWRYYGGQYICSINCNEKQRYISRIRIIINGKYDIHSTDKCTVKTIADYIVSGYRDRLMLITNKVDMDIYFRNFMRDLNREHRFHIFEVDTLRERSLPEHFNGWVEFSKDMNHMIHIHMVHQSLTDHALCIKLYDTYQTGVSRLALRYGDAS